MTTSTEAAHPLWWRRTPAVVAAATATFGAAVALPWIVNSYVISLMSTAVIVMLTAVSAQLLSSLAALPSIGQYVYVGIGAYTAAITARTVTDELLIQLAAATAIGAVAAALVGAGISHTRGTTYLLATLGVGELFTTIIEHRVSLTGGDGGLTTPTAILWPGTVPITSVGYLYLYTLAIATVTLAAAVLFMHTRTALVTRGIADNERRMHANGHHISRHLIAVSAVAGAIAAAAGALLVATNDLIAPTDIDVNSGALALLAAIIGGVSMVRTVLAAALIVAIADLVNNLLDGHGDLILGAIFIAVAIGRWHTGDQRRRNPARS